MWMKPTHPALELHRMSKGQGVHGRRGILLLGILGCVSLSGCIVMATKPTYRENKTVVVRELEGEWSEKDTEQSEEAVERMFIEFSGRKAQIRSAPEKPPEAEAHFFRERGILLADVSMPEDATGDVREDWMLDAG